MANVEDMGFDDLVHYDTSGSIAPKFLQDFDAEIMKTIRSAKEKILLNHPFFSRIDINITAGEYL